jgi:AcrR family transcriptional regulator
MKGDFRERALEQAKQDSESMKAKILKAAEDLFAERGFKGTTTRDIAERAGVNIALIHYHWGLKDELWNAVNANLLDQGVEFIREVLEKYPQPKTVEEGKEFISTLFNHMAETPNVARLGNSPGVNGPEELRIKDVAEIYFETLCEFIKEKTPLDFSPVEPELAVFLLLSAFNACFYRPDLLKLCFGEEPNNLSKGLRKKIGEALTVLVTRFGQVE